MASPEPTASLSLEMGSFLQATALPKRQVAVIVGSDPTATISSLSIALAAAQSTASALGQQLQQESLSIQQLQSASMSAMSSFQSSLASATNSAQSALAAATNSAQSALAAATNSANVAVASASNNAALAIANASNSLTNANVRASSAAIAAMAEADNRVSLVQGTTFSMTQITIAVVVSVSVTMLLTSLGFLAFLYRRQRKEKRATNSMPSLKRATADMSDDGTVTVWGDEYYQRRADTKAPKLASLHVRDGESPTLIDSVADVLSAGEKEQKRPDWPLGLDSPLHQPHAKTTQEQTTADSLSLFPKINEAKPKANASSKPS